MVHPDDDMLADLANTLRRVESRLGTLEDRVQSVERRIHPIEDRVSDLVTSVREMGGGPGMSAAPIERAVMRLSERIQRMEDLVGVEEDEPYPQRGFFGRLLRRD